MDETFFRNAPFSRSSPLCVHGAMALARGLLHAGAKVASALKPVVPPNIIFMRTCMARQQRRLACLFTRNHTAEMRLLDGKRLPMLDQHEGDGEGDVLPVAAVLLLLDAVPKLLLFLLLLVFTVAVTTWTCRLYQRQRHPWDGAMLSPPAAQLRAVQLEEEETLLKRRSSSKSPTSRFASPPPPPPDEGSSEAKAASATMSSEAASPTRAALQAMMRADDSWIKLRPGLAPADAEAAAESEATAEAAAEAKVAAAKAAAAEAAAAEAAAQARRQAAAEAAAAVWKMKRAESARPDDSWLKRQSTLEAAEAAAAEAAAAEAAAAEAAAVKAAAINAAAVEAASAEAAAAAEVAAAEARAAEARAAEARAAEARAAEAEYCLRRTNSFSRAVAPSPATKGPSADEVMGTPLPNQSSSSSSHSRSSGDSGDSNSSPSTGLAAAEATVLLGSIAAELLGRDSSAPAAPSPFEAMLAPSSSSTDGRKSPTSTSGSCALPSTSSAGWPSPTALTTTPSSAPKSPQVPLPDAIVMNTMDAASWMAGIPEAAASWDAVVGRHGIFVPPLEQLQRLHRSAKETLQLEAQSHRTLSTIDEGAAPEAAAPQPSCVSPAASTPQTLNSASTGNGRESDVALEWLSVRVAEAMALDINAAAPSAAASVQATVVMRIRATRQIRIRATGAEPTQVADESDPARREGFMRRGGHMRRSRSFEIGRALFTRHALSLRRTQSLERQLLREDERRDEREQRTPHKGWAVPRRLALLPLRSLLSRHWTPRARSPHEGAHEGARQGSREVETGTAEAEPETPDRVGNLMPGATPTGATTSPPTPDRGLRV